MHTFEKIVANLINRNNVSQPDSAENFEPRSVALWQLIPHFRAPFALIYPDAHLQRANDDDDAWQALRQPHPTRLCRGRGMQKTTKYSFRGHCGYLVLPERRRPIWLAVPPP